VGNRHCRSAADTTELVYKIRRSERRPGGRWRAGGVYNWGIRGEGPRVRDSVQPQRRTLGYALVGTGQIARLTDRANAGDPYADEALTWYLASKVIGPSFVSVQQPEAEPRPASCSLAIRYRDAMK
jgi:hypothetical protein